MSTNATRYRVVWHSVGGDLWLHKPSQAAPPNRLSLSRWTSKAADAYQWPTSESVLLYIADDAMLVGGMGIEVVPVDVVTDLVDLSVMDPYVISLDENAPNHVVREVSRSTPNKQGGKTRITYKGVT